jgi:hypothetical protein
MGEAYEQLGRTKHAMTGLEELGTGLLGKSEDVPAAAPKRQAADSEPPGKKMKKSDHQAAEPEAEPAPAEAESQQGDLSDKMRKLALREIGTVVQRILRGATPNEYLVCVVLLGIHQPDNDDDVQWENTKAHIAGSNGETNSKGNLISANGVDFFKMDLDFNELCDISWLCDRVHMPSRVLVSSANPDATFM